MNESTNTTDTVYEQDPRKVFFRDAAVFHGKLLLDGLRDFILFPVSLVAALVDLVRREESPGHRFYAVVHFGRETEQWIDLFEAAERAPVADRPRPNIGGPSLDEFIGDIEEKLRAGHEKGELSASAKQVFEEMLEAAKRTLERGRSRG